MNTPSNTIKIFIAYSRQDRKYLEDLRTYLHPLIEAERLEIWDDGEIIAGSNWNETIQNHLKSADIILLLISARSLASNYFYKKEMQHAIQRHENKEAIAIPIILSSCYWQVPKLKLNTLQALPKNAKPIKSWSDDSEAYTSVVSGIEKAIQSITTQKNLNDSKSTQKETNQSKTTIKPPKTNYAKMGGVVLLLLLLIIIGIKGLPTEETRPKEPTSSKTIEKDEPPPPKKTKNIDYQKNLASADENYNRKKYRIALSLYQKVEKIKTIPYVQKRIQELTLIVQEYDQQIQKLIDDMVTVESGIFTMGCIPDRDGECEDDEFPAHKVSLKSFQIGKYEVTQVQWLAVMEENPSYFKNCGGNCPVENVSWNNIQDFLKKLNQMTGQQFRLPTEAEWEFSARGGNLGKAYKYSGSNEIEEVAWYSENSKRRPHEVGTKKANELGLYDMSGNVWEWCEDYYDGKFYENSPESNPVNTTSSRYRVLRGGSWFFNDFCRVAIRFRNGPYDRDDDLGFRCAKTP